MKFITFLQYNFVGMSFKNLFFVEASKHYLCRGGLLASITPKVLLGIYVQKIAEFPFTVDESKNYQTNYKTTRWMAVK